MTDLHVQPDNEALNDLIRIATDGEDFYRDAALQVSDADIAAVFATMAEARARLIKDLSNWVATHGGEPPRDGTLLGAMRRLYAEGRAQLAADPDRLYIAQFEGQENQLLQQYQAVLQGSSDPAVRRVLLRHQRDVHKAHDRMCALKHRLQQEAA